jgi:hypothetical protein
LPSTRCRIQQSEVTTFAVRQLPRTSYPPVRRVEEQSDCHRSGPSDNKGWSVSLEWIGWSGSPLTSEQLY